jgi:sirohydrochlorin cobaltochelatase
VIAAFSQLITAALQIASADIPADETALLVVGRGSRDADSNAHVYQMARHLWETTRLGSLDICFHGVTKPDLAAGIQRCLQTGARRIVIVPYLLYDIALYRTLEHQVNQLRATTAADLILTAPLGIHDGILEAVSQRYDEALSALADALWDVPAERSAWNALYSYSTHSHGTNGSHTHNAQSILPPRYQGDVTVSAEPMSAADLIFDAEGKVAWNEIWGGFCDLALAGGPPHRGTLLEPATPEQVRSAPDDYQRVLAELERGLKMVTNLPVISSAAAGWIGLQCTDDAMAIWLLRAILVENVSVRREDNILYLPAGPYFLLHKEIKNVITVVAKTHHYWLEHLNGTSS